MEIDEALVAQFSAITDCPKRKAETYLRVSDMNLEQAIQLFFETGGVDMDVPASTSTPSAPPLPARPVTGAGGELIEIDDDTDEDLREALEASGGNVSASTGGAAAAESAAYDDEALARQLQQEFYGGGSGESNGVRAPMARTVETLVDEDDDYYSDPRRRTGARRGGMLF